MAYGRRFIRVARIGLTALLCLGAAALPAQVWPIVNVSRSLRGAVGSNPFGTQIGESRSALTAQGRSVTIHVSQDGGPVLWYAGPESELTTFTAEELWRLGGPRAAPEAVVFLPNERHVLFMPRYGTSATGPRGSSIPLIDT